MTSEPGKQTNAITYYGMSQKEKTIRQINSISQ